MKSRSALMTIWFQVGNQRHREFGRTFCSMDATMVAIIQSGRGSALLALTRFERAILQARRAGAQTPARR